MPLRHHARRRFGSFRPFTEALAGRVQVTAGRPLAGRYPPHGPYRMRELRGPTIDMDTDIGLVTVEVAFTVDRPFREVIELLDPQYWDLGGKYFYPDGTYLTNANRPDDRRCATCGASCTVPEAPGLPAGTDYGWKVLYEHFHGTDARGFDVSFHNLLWVNPDLVTSPRGGRMYVVTYALHSSLCGRADFVSGITFERDDGDVSAEELDAASTRIHMRKHIRFTSEWANVTTYIAYRYVGAETAADLLGVVSAALPPA